MVITKHSRISLYPLQINKDKKHFIVEDKLTGEFYEMPEICIEAIALMNEGQPLYLVEEILKERYPDEQVDMQNFAGELLELGLVKIVDGNSIPKEVENKKKNGGLEWIPASVGHFFFNRYSTIFYSLIFLGSIILLALNPGLFPVYDDVFLFDLMIYNILIFLSISFIFVVVHEIGHVLAIRAEGLPTKIELGHRLFFIVLETDMSRVWSLEPKKRNRLYLAGIYFDVIVLFLAILVQLLFVDHFFVVGIAKMAVISTFIRIIYQFCVYMKTDMYYVLENCSSCYNLMENGKTHLKQWIPFISIDEKSTTFEGEEKFVRSYALFYLLGVVLTFGVTVFYTIPLIVHAGLLVLPGFTEPSSSIHFWDATVFFLQFILMFGLLAYSWTKKYREKQKRQPV
jgi:putative peptide zinc metalloprotease protein